MKPAGPKLWSLLIIVLQSQMVQKEMADELQERLTAAEQALAVKQDAIDKMKQEIFQKEKELETISVFQAQVRGHINGNYFFNILLAIR